jgi:RNA recognition motif-containing protein
MSLFLYRYAFILFDDEQQVIRAIQNTDQYQINGQSLAVSLYRNGRSSYTMWKEPLVD